MRKLLIIMLIVLPFIAVATPKQKRETAVFHVEIKCDNCVRNIQNNIAFERGLKDMRIDKKQQTVTLTWDPQRTDTTTLKQAFIKIKKPVKKIEMQTK